MCFGFFLPAHYLCLWDLCALPLSVSLQGWESGTCGYGGGSCCLGDWVPLLCLGYPCFGAPSLVGGYCSWEGSQVNKPCVLLPGSLWMLALLWCGWEAGDISPLQLSGSPVVWALPWLGQRDRFWGVVAAASSLPFCWAGLWFSGAPWLLCCNHVCWGCGLSCSAWEVRVPSLSHSAFPKHAIYPPSDILLGESFRLLCTEQRNLCCVINVLLVADWREDRYKDVFSFWLDAPSISSMHQRVRIWGVIRDSLVSCSPVVYTPIPLC